MNPRALTAVLGTTAAVALGVAAPAGATPPLCSQAISGSNTVVTCNYTGAVQAWQAPAGVTQATFDVFGAQGGNLWSNGPVVILAGPNGAEARAVNAVSSGTVYEVFVGGAGGSLYYFQSSGAAGGFNGGAAGGHGNPTFQGGFGGSAGGGGGSDVRAGAYGLDDRIIVAGGGGGITGAQAGGGAGGQNGNNGAAYPQASMGGRGATQSGGGAAGSGCNPDGTFCVLGQGGSKGVGGIGASHNLEFGGGGGGGGYYGGGGGSSSECVGCGGYGGGGGGSSIGPTGTAYTTGARGGHGLVTITYATPANAAPTCNDVSATTAKSVAVAVQLSCSEATGAVIQFALVSNPSHGSLGTLSDTGQVTYTPTTGFTGTDSFQYQAMSTNGTSLTKTVSINIAGPPTAQIATPADGAVLAQNQVVNASYSCTAGAPGGVLKTSGGCTGPVASGAAIDTSTTGSHTFTVTATDTDNQTGTATSHYTVMPPAAPKVSITAPADGAVYAVNQAVSASYVCTAGVFGGVLKPSGGCVGSVGTTSLASGSAVDTSTPGSFTLTVTATDTDGQTGQAVVHYRVSGPPSAQITTPPDAAIYALNQVVSASYSCTAGLFGGVLKSSGGCSGPVASGAAIDTSTTGSHTFTVTATDTDNQARTATSHYTVSGPPAAQITTPTDGAVYALNQGVNASYSCTAGSNGGVLKSSGGCVGKVGTTSLASGAAVDTSTPGSFTLTVTATDTDGQTGQAVVHYRVSGPPSAQITTPPDGAIYALNQVVNAGYSCTAGPFGGVLKSSGGCVGKVGTTSLASGSAVDTSTPGSFTLTVTATDTDGQTGQAVVHYRVSGPPTAQITTPPDGAVYALNQVVNAGYSCTAGSNGGVLKSSGGCVGKVGTTSLASGAAVDTSTPGSFTLTVTATDTDGQTGGATSHYTVSGPPSAQVTTPPDGAVYALNQVVSASYSCTPGSNLGVLQSGWAGCSGPVAIGSAIDTSTTGSHTFTVTATDTDKQTGTATSHYTVSGPPAASIATPTDGAVYALNQVVNAGYSCTAGSNGGVLKSSGGCVGKVGTTSLASGGAVDTSTPGSFTLTVIAADTDGQTGQAVAHYMVSGPPSAQITTPTDGGVYPQGQAVNASYSCTAGAFGGVLAAADGCVGTVGATKLASGSPLDTTTPGSFTLNVAATGTDNQAGSATSHYSVCVPGTLISPTDGQTNVTGEAPFTWCPVAGAQYYYLTVGSQPAGYDVVNSGNLPAGQTSFNTGPLPPGMTLYTRLYTFVNGNWTTRDSSFSTPAVSSGALTYPTDGQTGVVASHPFTWTASSQAQYYYLTVGSTPAGYDVVNSGNLPASQTSYTASSLPAGTTLYARLYSYINGGWVTQDISFTT